MKDPNYAPVYACLYPKLAEVVRSHGYALAVHGSLVRDFDLICVPWIEKPEPPQKVVDSIVNKFSIVQIGDPVMKLHNRLVFTISLSFGDCSLDLSFMPVKE